MSTFDVNKLLLCFNHFTPLEIQVTSILLSILGEILIIIGLSQIPFKIDSDIYKYLFSFNIPLLIFIILVNITFFIFRHLNLMNNQLNLWGYGLSVVEIYISFFGTVANILNDFMIINSMKHYQEVLSKKDPKKFPMLTNEQIIYTKLILLIMIIIWVNIILLSFSDNLLINLAIDGSYYQYNLSRNIEKNITSEEKKKNKKKKFKVSTVVIKDNDNDKNKNTNTNNIDNTNININASNNTDIKNYENDNYKESFNKFVIEENHIDKNLGVYEEKKI